MALRPGSAIVVPTKPAGSDPTTAAAPAPTPTSDAAPETAPATTASVRPPTAAPVPNTQPDESPEHADGPATKTSQGAAGNANNQWPLPPVNTEPPTTTNALSVLLSAMSSKAQADAAAHTPDGTGDSNNGQQHAGTQHSDSSSDQAGSQDPGGAGQEGGSHKIPAQPDHASGSKDSTEAGNQDDSHNGDSQQSGHDSANAGTRPGESAHSDDPSDAIDPESPAQGDQATVTWNHEGQAFTAISSNGAVIVQGNGAKSTLAAGATATFEGQVIEVPSAGNAVVINGAAASFTFPAGSGNKQGNDDPPTAIFTESGRTFTVAAQGNSLVLEAAGSTTTMAYGSQGTFAGQSVSMPSSPDDNVLNINGKPFQLQQDNGDTTNGKGAALRTQTAAVITQDGKTFTAILQSASAVVLQAASTTLTMPPGAVVTLDGEVFSVPTGGSSILVHDGTTFTLTPTALPSAPLYTAAATGQPLAAFDVGSSIVVIASGSTITLADGAQTMIGAETISAASTGGAVVVVNSGETSTLIASSDTRTDTATDPSSASVGVDSEASAETSTSPDAESAAAPSTNGGSLAVWMSVLLGFVAASCVVVVL